MSEAKDRRPRMQTPTAVELRLRTGSKIIKTTNPDAPRGAFYTFADSGSVARADIVERLIAAGKLLPQGDGLFGDSQTWALAKTV